MVHNDCDGGSCWECADEARKENPMTTNPLRADELRERIAQELKPKIQAVANSAYGAGGMADYECEEEAYDFADQVLALLTPPPSLASVVAEIDDLIERNNLAMHRDGSVSGLFMGSLAWKLFNNWPSLRTALTISGTGWRDDMENAPKDGTRVLLSHGRPVKNAPRHAYIGKYLEAYDQWLLDSGLPMNADKFRYWMPIEPLPQPKTGEG